MCACHETRSHRYIASEKDKQATFTGAQQRAGVYALPFAVDGIFGFGRPRPKSQANSKKSRKAARASHVPEGVTGGDMLFKEGGPDEGDEELPAGFSFDWGAYKEKFGETPIQQAVTIMFSEYASLYGRIAGWTTSATPVLMTLAEGESIADQAENFVINIMSPILGLVHTSKVHKLLCHVKDAIRYHGNLRVGNTADNEATHKDDKPFYRRTNMNLSTFTQQLVRQSQGARHVLRNNATLDAEAYRTLPLVPNPRASGRQRAAVAATRDGTAASAAAAGSAGTNRAASEVTASDRAPTAGGGGAVCAEAVRAATSGGPGAAADAAAAASINGAPSTNQKRTRSANNLERSTIGDLSQRPGLRALGELFNLPSDRKVPVLATVEFDAVFDCQTRSKQLLRASPKFKTGKPWYDTILFTLDAEDHSKDGVHGNGGGLGESRNGSGASGGVADAGAAANVIHAGEVRAIIRCKDDDYAIICEMDVVDAEPGCPFNARFCTRFKWAGHASSGSVIRAVPLRNVTRVIHVVPDFKDLASRKGLGAAPARYDGSRADLHAMRYFLNEFYPWGTR